MRRAVLLFCMAACGPEAQRGGPPQAPASGEGKPAHPGHAHHHLHPHESGGHHHHPHPHPHFEGQDGHHHPY